MSDIRQPEFGRRLRELRVARGVSQRYVAGNVVNPSYISLLESGARVPTLEVVMHIARVLDVSASDLAAEVGVLPQSDTPAADQDRLIRHILAGNSTGYGDLDDAQQRFEEAFELAKKDRSSAAVLEYGMRLHDILEMQGIHEQRYDLLVELVELATNLDIPEVLLKLRVDLASTARDSGRLAEAVEVATGAVEGLEETNLVGTSEHVRAQAVLVSVYCDSGDFTEVPKLCKRLVAIAQELGSAPLTGRAHWAAAIAYGRLAQVDEAQLHVRKAMQLLANPATPLRDWARFARAAANALLDAQADVEEVQRYLAGARATFELLDAPHEKRLLQLTEAKYALACDKPERALALTEHEPENLDVADTINFRRTRGRALRRTGAPIEQAVQQLSSAAMLAEEQQAFRAAASLWREIADLRAAGSTG